MSDPILLNFDGPETIKLGAVEGKIIRGVSPTVNVVRNQTDDGVDITVVDIDGSRTASVYDGPQGPKGDTGATGATGPQGDPGIGIPTGGTAGQVLAKKTGTDYDTEWVDQSGGGGAVESVNGQTGAVVLDAEDVGAYEMPSGGIPKADLDSAVQTSLGKADTALQEHQDISGKVNEPATEGTSGQVLTTDGQGGRTWETPSGGVQDVQVNGTSVLDAQGVANVPVATASSLGVSRPDNGGIGINASGQLTIKSSPPVYYKGGTGDRPITASMMAGAAFYGIAKAAGDATQSASSNAVGTYTESAKSAISEMLNGSVAITGTTPTINALSGVRYICGEVTTIDITTPASGIVDVVFESGSTPTVLTVTPPSGMTMKWANGFDPDNLEANTVYEINIMDGCLGVAGAWT